MVRWRRYWGSVKPAWMKGELFPFLVMQAFASIFILFVAIGFAVGYIQPTKIPDDRIMGQTIFLCAWSSFSLIAIVGLYRDRWWAYYMELALVWAIAISVPLFPLPDNEPPRPEIWEPPYFDYVKSTIALASFIGMNWLLLSRGRRKYCEQVVAGPSSH